MTSKFVQKAVVYELFDGRIERTPVYSPAELQAELAHAAHEVQSKGTLVKNYWQEGVMRRRPRPDSERAR